MTPTRARLRPWTRAGIDALADGPRPKREVIAIAAAIVPPGMAMRLHAARTRGTSRRHLSPEHRQASGARWVAGRNFNAMLRMGTILEFEHDGEPYWELSSRAHLLLTK